MALWNINELQSINNIIQNLHNKFSNSKLKDCMFEIEILYSESESGNCNCSFQMVICTNWFSEDHFRESFCDVWDDEFKGVTVSYYGKVYVVQHAQCEMDTLFELGDDVKMILHIEDKLWPK